MKKILLIFVSVILFSCASSPEKPVEEKPVKEEVQEKLSNSELREKAYNAMQKALGIKANIAVKDDYTAAEKMFNEAEAMDTSNPESAAKAALIYTDAEKAFESVYDKAYEKRENARKELEMAENEIKAVEDDAAEAEAEAKGGTE